jgi:hypothetical protein
MYIYRHDFSDAQAESEGQNISKLRYRRYRPASIQVIDKNRVGVNIQPLLSRLPNEGEPYVYL